MLIGQVLETSAAQLQLLESQKNSHNINKMQIDIEKIKQKLNII